MNILRLKKENNEVAIKKGKIHPEEVKDKTKESSKAG